MLMSPDFPIVQTVESAKLPFNSKVPFQTKYVYFCINGFTFNNYFGPLIVITVVLRTVQKLVDPPIHYITCVIAP